MKIGGSGQGDLAEFCLVGCYIQEVILYINILALYRKSGEKSVFQPFCSVGVYLRLNINSDLTLVAYTYGNAAVTVREVKIKAAVGNNAQAGAVPS